MKSEMVKNLRNPIHRMDLEVLRNIQVDATGVQDRVSKITKTRNPKKEHQAAWLKQAVGMMDLTSLEGSDTPGRIRRLCQKALRPIPGEPEFHAAAVCVYGNLVGEAKKVLRDSPVKVAAVSTAFPHGQVSFSLKVQETKSLVAMGADEIDMVINRSAYLRGDTSKVYDEVAMIREACGPAHLKVILETGELGELRNVWVASEIAMQAGADFIKTSTGKIPSAATLPVSLVMLNAIQDFYLRTGCRVGHKPAGGIRQAKEALHWLALVKETVGEEWMTPDFFRFGASSLLDDVLRQLHHLETGQYEAYDYIPKG
ncbi:MAG: deoxyribose-phosphate aldolase [Elusimicrobia bacterium]|nr:deoxyribose-phosphate aldolase [Elusimicrobiota bacterium]